MKRLLLLAVVASAMFMIPSSASAAVSCNLVGGTLTIDVTGTGDQVAGVIMANGGNDIVVHDTTSFSTPQVCGGAQATQANTNAITFNDVEATTQRTIVAISQAGGPLVNADATGEGAGTKEIEITVNGGDEATDDLLLAGGPGPAGDNWRMGELAGGNEGYQLDDTEPAGASDVDDVTAVGVEQLQIGINGNPGDDVVDGRGGAGFTAPLSLGSTVAQFIGGAGNDQLFAGDSNGWRLEGDEGADTMIGGAGGEFIQLSFGADADTADGNGGNDNCSYLNHNDPVKVDFRITGPQDTVGAGIDTISDCEVLTGGNAGDTLIGTDGPNTVLGGSGDDTIMGLGGSDTLDGNGNIDTVSYAQGSTGPVSVDIGNAGAQNTGGAGTDTLANFESLTGSPFSDTLTGNSGANVIDGHDGGPDTIACAGGVDGVVADEVGIDGGIDAVSCEVVDTAPQISVAAPPADGAVSSDTTPTYALSADEAATFQLSVDGGGFGACAASCEVPALAEGAHTLRFRAVDTDENLSVGLNAAVRTLTVDTTAPAVSITGGPFGSTDDTTPTFEFSVGDASSFQCRVDGEAFAACSGPGASHTTAALAAGAHTFEVQGTDAAGNASTASRAFEVVPPSVTEDKTPPQTTVTKVKVKKNKATVTFSSDEAGSTFTCKLDKQAAAPCSSPATFKKLKPGKHKVLVTATDAVGNKDATPAVAKFKVKKPKK